MRYLSAHLFGYAFAIFAQLRAETDPKWMRFLRLDAVHTMRKGLRFLDSGAKSLLHFPLSEAKSLSVLRDQLRAKEASLRLASLWEIAFLGPSAAELMPLVIDRLTDKDPEVRAMAATALASFGDIAKSNAMEIVPRVRDDNVRVRLCAVHAIAVLLPNADHVLPDLYELLMDDDVDVILASVKAIRAYGMDENLPLKSVLQAYLRNQNNCYFEILDAFAEILAPIPNLRERIHDCFPDWEDGQRAELADDILNRVVSSEQH